MENRRFRRVIVNSHEQIDSLDLPDGYIAVRSHFDNNTGFIIYYIYHNSFDLVRDGDITPIHPGKSQSDLVIDYYKHMFVNMVYDLCPYNPDRDKALLKLDEVCGLVRKSMGIQP